MISVIPPVIESKLQLKETASSAVHTTGDLYTFNLQNNTFGIINRINFQVSDESGITTNYNGHVRVTVTGKRRKDGSALQIGTCTYYPQGITQTPVRSDNTNGLTANIIKSDAAWDSWSNGGILKSIGSKFESYLRMSVRGSTLFLQFYKWFFARREKDPIYNQPFLNDYALDYKITVELLHRKGSRVLQENTINVLPNISANALSGGANLRPLVNTAQGTNAELASRFNRIGAYNCRDLWIMNTAQHDFLMTGRYVNETGSAGTSEWKKFSEMIKPDGLNKNIYSIDWYRSMLNKWATNNNITISSQGLPLGFFAVDESDPGNGGNPTIYHQTNWGMQGTNTTRAVGWTSFSGTGSNNSTFGTATLDGTGVYTNISTYDKFPVIVGTGNTNMFGNPAWTGPPQPTEIFKNCRVNNRPAVLVRQVANGIGINNGTYAAPVYNTYFRFLSTGTDTANVKFFHNYTGSTDLDVLKRKTIYTAVAGDGDWVYMDLIDTTNSNRRQFARMRYKGPANPTNAQAFNMDNWEAQDLANWSAAGGNGSTVQPLNSATTYTLSTWPENGFIFTQAIDTSRIVNGFPTFWGFLYNKLFKLTHNGGSSATLSDNWNVEIVAGSTVTSTVNPVEGQAFNNTDFATNITNTWFHRKQIVGDWLYFGNYLDHYVGRVNINPSSSDYLKFEVLNNVNLLTISSARL